MSDETPKKRPFLLEVPIVSLDPQSLRARIWEKAGFDIGENDPLHAAQVIYVAAMEDQARLLDLQAERMNTIFGDHLEIFHAETEAIIKGIHDEISTQAVRERMAAMAEQISQADILAKAIKSTAKSYRIYTLINVMSLVGAVTIFLSIYS